MEGIVFTLIVLFGFFYMFKFFGNIFKVFLKGVIFIIVVIYALYPFIGDKLTLDSPTNKVATVTYTQGLYEIRTPYRNPLRDADKNFGNLFKFGRFIELFNYKRNIDESAIETKTKEIQNYAIGLAIGKLSEDAATVIKDDKVVKFLVEKVLNNVGEKMTAEELLESNDYDEEVEAITDYFRYQIRSTTAEKAILKYLYER